MHVEAAQGFRMTSVSHNAIVIIEFEHGSLMSVYALCHFHVSIKLDISHTLTAIVHCELHVHNDSSIFNGIGIQH